MSPALPTRDPGARAKRAIAALALGLAALTLAGCPGQRRPPPWAIEALRKQAEEDKEREERERLRKAAEAAASPSAPTTQDEWTRRTASFEALVAGIEREAETAPRSALLERCKAAEERGFALQEASIEAENEQAEEALTTLLERLQVARAAIVERKP